MDSVVIKILSKDSVQSRIPRYEYEYELLPKIFDPAAKALVKKQYIFDPGRNEYIAAAPPEGKAGLELLDALSGVFLYEKNSFLADTFRDSANPNIAVYRNGKALGRGSSFDGAGYKAGDSIDLVVPAAAIRGSYAARIRINYKGGEYQEEKILVYNQQSGSPGPARLCFRDKLYLLNNIRRPRPIDLGFRSILQNDPRCRSRCLGKGSYTPGTKPCGN